MKHSSYYPINKPKTRRLIMGPKKNILYVGGIDGAVTEEIIFAAFAPFGDVKSIQIPKDFVESKLALAVLDTLPNF